MSANELKTPAWMEFKADQGRSGGGGVVVSPAVGHRVDAIPPAGAESPGVGAW